MCGITGLLHFDPNRPVHAEQIDSMNERLLHRGPDADGHWVRGAVGLGHRRLSIIDLSEAASQPMTNEDGSIVLVVNGEIYNFQSLRTELQNAGHRFRSQSDSEVILHLYEEKGVDCLKELRGMFAFALWDARRNRLFLARDRVGKKPLKYYVDDERFAFASELKALLALPEVPREEDRAAVHHYLALGYCPAPYTGLKNIYKLPPAHYLLVENGRPSVHRYWRLSYAEKRRRSEAEWCEALMEAFDEAVRIRMISDVPLGAFLSGGLDSGSIVARMAEASSKPVKTFSIGFTYEKHNELPFAKQVAERYKTEHHEFILEPEEADIFSKLVHLYEEPYNDSSALPTYYVSKFARESVTVALNGDGGDECFGGYERYTVYEKYERLARWLLPFGGRYAAELAARCPWLPATIRRKGVTARGLLQPDPAARYVKFVSFFDADKREQLYTDSFAEGLRELDPTEIYRRDYHRDEAGTHPVERAIYADFHNYLPGDLLPKVDIASMAHGLEARSPLLDHKLLELTASIPYDLKTRDGQKKYIFRQAIRSLLPEALFSKPKTGFGIPIDEWFAGAWREMAWDTLLGERSLARGCFRPETVRGILEAHDAGDYRGYYIWQLLCLEEWRRQYVDAG